MARLHPFAWLMRATPAKCLAVLLFALPTMLGGLLASSGTQENRNLAAFPATPHTWPGLLAYPRQIDGWINDHLGLRQQWIASYNWLRHTLFEEFPTIQVVAGRRQRIYLATHNTHLPAYSAILGPCGYQFASQTQLIQEINGFTDTMAQIGIDARLMIVPSSPVVHADDLPRWLRDRCHAQPTPFEQIWPGLSQPSLQKSLYPLAAMRGQPVFPNTFFHWGGAGTKLGADLAIQRFWPGQVATPVVTAPVWAASDLSGLFPGVTLGSTVESIDFGASGITQCGGAGCFPELQDVMEIMAGVTRYTNPKAQQPRLVLITDSFGLALAPWTARYYREVIQVSTNELVRLKPDQAERLRQFLFARHASQHTLFVYHDGTILASRLPQDLRDLVPDRQHHY